MIVPKPLNAVYSNENTLSLSHGIQIRLEGLEEYCTEVFLERSGLTSNKNGVAFLIRRDAELEQEEYDLTANEKGVVISAGSERAAIYALTTLYQLLGGTSVAHCHIHDKPKYAHRGQSFDSVRHFFDADEVKRVLEQMSLVKMNVLHWHLSDDQGWRIESKRFPKLHEQCPHYSQEEIRSVVEFARVRGIDVIPELDMPGHMTGLLAAYPEYSCSGKQVEIAQYGGIYPIILCGGKEETYKFIEELLDEIVPLFPAPRFHVGGDEAPKKEWNKCPHCQKRMEQEGLANTHDLQAYFSNRVAAMLKKHGKTAICWNDSQQASCLDKDIQIQFWSVQYEDDFHKVLDCGGKFIYSDMFTYYFDYPISMSPLRRVYSDPIAVKGQDLTGNPGMLGIESCLWAEYIETNAVIEERLFPRLYAVGEIGWSGQGDYPQFKARLKGFVQKHHPETVVCVPYKRWDPKGLGKLKETLSYMKKLQTGMPPEIRKETVESAAPNKAFSEKFAKSFFR